MCVCACVCVRACVRVRVPIMGSDWKYVQFLRTLESGEIIFKTVVCVCMCMCVRECECSYHGV